MTNVNCLIGFQCPQCGDDESFDIEIKTTVTVTDDGTGDTRNAEWEDDSPCQCNNCGHTGKVLDFQKESNGMSNATRAERAENALRAYVEAKGEVFENSSDEIADLMADLLHLTQQVDQGYDPIESTLRLAQMHYKAERIDPEFNGENAAAEISKGLAS